jgi:membrane protease YdiL (CAAX protease family)
MSPSPHARPQPRCAHRLGKDAPVTAPDTTDAVVAGPSHWLLVAAVLVALPVLNAHVGVPYVEASLPGNEAAWMIHRLWLVVAHVSLVLLVVAWATRSGLDLRLRDHVVPGLAALVVFTLVALVVVLQRPVVPLLEQQDYGSFSRAAQLLSVSSILWAGLGQEILFRSFALPVLERHLGSAALAVVITAVAFGYYHGGFSFGVGNLAANMAGGVVLGLLFVATRNTWAVAVPHALLVTVLLIAA